MTSSFYLILLVVFVVIGLALGLGLALLIAQLTNGAAFANPFLALVLVFGCCALGVLLMYSLAALVERLARRGEIVERAKTREERAARRKRRKKK
jgi:uncharacterized protein YacL